MLCSGNERNVRIDLETERRTRRRPKGSDDAKVGERVREGRWRFRVALEELWVSREVRKGGGLRSRRSKEGTSAELSAGKSRNQKRNFQGIKTLYLLKRASLSGCRSVFDVVGKDGRQGREGRSSSELYNFPPSLPPSHHLSHTFFSAFLSSSLHHAF